MNTPTATIIATLATASLALASGAATADEATLRVVASGIKGSTGNLVVWVYDDPERWLSDEVFRRAMRPVEAVPANGELAIELSLPPGDYALSVFHDVDGDEKLKRNFIGIPKEPSGLSNNAVPRSGPPKYEDSRFTVGSEAVEQRIQLN